MTNLIQYLRTYINSGVYNLKLVEPLFIKFAKGEAGGEKRERVKGIEPSYAAWEAAVLPLNYTRRLM